MRKNKFSKFIERILVCLPLLFVGITSAYVVFNKNAKDNYDFSNFVVSNDFIINDKYYLQGNSLVRNVEYSFYDLNIVSNGSILDYVLNSIIDNINDISRIQIDNNGDTHFFVGANYITTISNGTYYLLDFIYLSHTGNIDNSLYVNSNNLSNVFEYSLSKFNDMGFGKLDFTSWFTNIFMNGNTSNVYVQFVNSYLNYFLMVEVVYFIPMIIYWFIHFGESIIEKLTSKEF